MTVEIIDLASLLKDRYAIKEIENEKIATNVIVRNTLVTSVRTPALKHNSSNETTILTSIPAKKLRLGWILSESLGKATSNTMKGTA
ncbi:hypothetical protein [Haloferax volcanii]|uniref:hypothetical protein n=2 Tax=Haloferax TaxID=2251 RepID=UPI0023DBB441|nr:hypothetical protein [Haloferax lucentense]